MHRLVKNSLVFIKIKFILSLGWATIFVRRPHVSFIRVWRAKLRSKKATQLYDVMWPADRMLLVLF